MSPPCCASCDTLPALSSLNPPQNPNITPFPNTSFTPQHPCPTEPQRVLYSAYPPDAHDCTYTQLGTNYAKISFTRSLFTQAHVRVCTHTLSALMFYAPPSLCRFRTHGLRASVPFEKKQKKKKQSEMRETKPLWRRKWRAVLSLSPSLSLDMKEAYVCLCLRSAHSLPQQTARLWITAIPPAWLFIYLSGNSFILRPFSSSCLRLFLMNWSH